jgi:hypothetical protein
MGQFALMRLAHHWDNIAYHKRDQFSEISCLCEDDAGW